MTPLDLDGNTLNLSNIREVAQNHRRVQVSAETLARVAKARALVDEVAAGSEAAYGINTGFGTLSEIRIEKQDLQTLQRNLIVSHAAGVGKPLSIPEARALLLLRCNVLAKGYSGVRPVTLQLGIEMLNRGVTPVVPERGSVGASGDLAPLAHLALVFIGEGEAFFDGQRMPGREALRKAGLEPIVLQAKEGLTLVNGTQAMCAVGVPSLLVAEELAELFDVAGAMTIEGMLGSDQPFVAGIHALRPHPGHGQVSQHMRSLLLHSELVESHKECYNVQYHYSMI
jgi:histidine ammonia-lyase